ncbi:hypothetical protein GCM10025858_40260 [Alicyclobacillus sacchari]|nr:hypothetical protein GCM10025858_40260 [Alicyclobacillus sacchari]
MPRRPDFKAGSVLSFRIPENISEEDLEHLSRIAKRSTRGRAGAVSEFFSLRSRRIGFKNHGALLLRCLMRQMTS